MYIKIELKGKSFWWTLRGANNKIFATSETFTRPSDCVRSAQTVTGEIGLVIKYSNKIKGILEEKGIDA